jgi:hypothetical protein
MLRKKHETFAAEDNYFGPRRQRRRKKGQKLLSGAVKDGWRHSPLDRSKER